jgi:TonB family protein
MANSLRNVGMIALLAALVSAAGAHARSAAAQPPQTASAPDIQALAARIDTVRRHYTSSRVSAARDELSGVLEQVRAAREAGGAKATTPAAGQLPRAGRDVAMPGLVKRVDPDYPLEAATKGVTGHVVVDLEIDKSGRVRNPRIAVSIPQLDPSALSAVRKWRFAKPRFNGAPADIAATVALGFTLRRDPLPVSDLDLARFYVARDDVPAAEAPLARALGSIARESECNAAVADAAGEQRRAGGDGYEPPRKIKHQGPFYSALALKAKVTGTVAMDAVIGLDGRPTCVRVLRSVPLLDQAAIDAVSRWEFTPARRNGVPIPTRVSMEVNFAIR